MAKRATPKTETVHHRYTVHVRQKHWDEAKPHDSGKCLITEAVKEAIPEARNVWTDFQSINFRMPDGSVHKIFTPRPALQTLALFDLGNDGKFRPFSFVLEFDTQRPIKPKPEPRQSGKPTGDRKAGKTDDRQPAQPAAAHTETKTEPEPEPKRKRMAAGDCGKPERKPKGRTKGRTKGKAAAATKESKAAADIARQERIVELASKVAGPTVETVARDKEGMPIVGQAQRVRLFGANAFFR